jgi:hypothetical protein
VLWTVLCVWAHGRCRCSSLGHFSGQSRIGTQAYGEAEPCCWIAGAGGGGVGWGWGGDLITYVCTVVVRDAGLVNNKRSLVVVHVLASMSHRAWATNHVNGVPSRLLEGHVHVMLPLQRHPLAAPLLGRTPVGVDAAIPLGLNILPDRDQHNLWRGEKRNKRGGERESGRGGRVGGWHGCACTRVPCRSHTASGTHPVSTVRSPPPLCTSCHG